MSSKINIYNYLLTLTLENNFNNGWQINIVRSDIDIGPDVFFIINLIYKVDGREITSRQYLPKKFIEEFVDEKNYGVDSFSWKNINRKISTIEYPEHQIVKFVYTQTTEEKIIFFPKHLFEQFRLNLNLVYYLIYYFEKNVNANITEIRHYICLAMLRKLLLKAIAFNDHPLQKPIIDKEKYVAEYLIKANGYEEIPKVYYGFFSKLMNKDLTDEKVSFEEDVAIVLGNLRSKWKNGVEDGKLLSALEFLVK
ncbi:MAG: hypothetical protein QM535_22740 [Limnohabitans sp.]|nr:hypothetical protein [Limnohabitans sp.]